MVKQVIVLNASLEMSPGKAAAQAAHAAIGAFERARREDVARWHEAGVTKIVLKISDTALLLDLASKVKGLPHYLVADAGRTEVEPGSLTALAIGPCEAGLIDKFTSSLPLY